MATNELPPVGEIANLVFSGGGYALLAYFVRLLGTKKLAWWYQIEERDALVKKAEERADECKEQLKKRDDQYWALREIAFKSLDVSEKQVGIK